MTAQHDRGQAFGDAVGDLAQRIFGLLQGRGFLPYRIGEGDRDDAEDHDAAYRGKQAVADAPEVDHAAPPGIAAVTRLRPLRLAS